MRFIENDTSLDRLGQRLFMILLIVGMILAIVLQPGPLPGRDTTPTVVQVTLSVSPTQTSTGFNRISKEKNTPREQKLTSLAQSAPASAHLTTQMHLPLAIAHSKIISQIQVELPLSTMVSSTLLPQSTPTPVSPTQATLTPPPQPIVTPSPTATPTGQPTLVSTPTVPPTQQPAPTLNITPVERFLRVNQDEQMMQVYENGVEIRTIPVSTGAPTLNTFTPAWRGEVGFDWGSGPIGRGDFSTDHMWYLFAGPEGSILIHSVPYTRNGVGKEYDRLESLGIEPTSHGCVRISPKDAAWLKTWNPVGVPIEITRLSRRIGPANNLLSPEMNAAILFEDIVRGSNH